MEKVKIRDLVPSDIENVLDYRQESGKISFQGQTIDRERERGSIKEHAEKYPGTIKVAEIGGKPAGYIRFELKKSSFGDYGLINAIFVEKDFRSGGLGKLLIKAAEEWFASMGIFSVEATITNTNLPSLSFFRSLGYLEKRTVVEKKLN
jgi:ribosomal protein S18 acetylase RimI-like enzyme